MRKAYYFASVDMCRYFLSLNVPRNWRNQLKIRVLFHVMPLSLHRRVWEWIAFHTENRSPPAVCILDRGCIRAICSRKAVEAFCRYAALDPNSGLWNAIQPISSRFFSAYSQESKNALRSLCYSCVIMDRTLSSPRSTVSKKVMFHGLYNLDKEFLSDLSPDKASCPACVLVWETGFENSHKYSSHFGSARFRMAHWPGSCQDYKKQKSFSHHDHFECSRGAVQ